MPVGTVVHLVQGEVPSLFEQQSSAALDPWEIPGSLDVNLSESHQKPTSVNPNTVEAEGTVDIIYGSSTYIKQTVEESLRKREPTHASLSLSLPRSSLSNSKSRAPNEDFFSDKEEEESEFESVETNDGMSEPELGEQWEEKEQIQHNVAELTEEGQRIIVARGGEGGAGNISSSKNSRKHKLGKAGSGVSDDDESSPGIGSPGSEAILVLELKSIADVGLVGFPNAGKSTLLGALSRAKPTVGHYAFTTLRPNIGNLKYDDLSVTVADIPGLIKGAHENRGLGHAFLRHIERTKVIAYVVDLAAGLDGRKGIPPWEQLKDLILELEYYQEGLSSRPSLVVANKIDEAGAEEVYEELKTRVKGVPIFPVCAVLAEGIPDLRAGLKVLVNGAASCGLTLDRIVVDQIVS